MAWSEWYCVNYHYLPPFSSTVSSYRLPIPFPSWRCSCCWSCGVLFLLPCRGTQDGSRSSSRASLPSLSSPFRMGKRWPQSSRGIQAFSGKEQKRGRNGCGFMAETYRKGLSAEFPSPACGGPPDVGRRQCLVWTPQPVQASQGEDGRFLLLYTVCGEIGRDFFSRSGCPTARRCSPT